jgi:hypothetical protein
MTWDANRAGLPIVSNTVAFRTSNRTSSRACSWREAAIIYFVEMISIRETAHKKDKGLVGVMSVPSHQWVRVEDQEPPSR